MILAHEIDHAIYTAEKPLAHTRLGRVLWAHGLYWLIPFSELKKMEQRAAKVEYDFLSKFLKNDSDREQFVQISLSDLYLPHHIPLQKIVKVLTSIRMSPTGIETGNIEYNASFDVEYLNRNGMSKQEAFAIYSEIDIDTLERIRNITRVLSPDVDASKYMNLHYYMTGNYPKAAREEILRKFGLYGIMTLIYLGYTFSPF